MVGTDDCAKCSIERSNASFGINEIIEMKFNSTNDLRLVPVFGKAFLCEESKKPAFGQTDRLFCAIGLVSIDEAHFMRDSKPSVQLFHSFSNRIVVIVS